MSECAACGFDFTADGTDDHKAREGHRYLCSTYARYRGTLLEALKPLAALKSHYRNFDEAQDWQDMGQLGDYITVADVRRAAALLPVAQATATDQQSADDATAHPPQEPGALRRPPTLPTPIPVSAKEE